MVGKRHYKTQSCAQSISDLYSIKGTNSRSSYVWVSEHPRPSRVMRTLSETAEAISTPPQSSTISRKLSFRQNNSDSQPESLVTPILRKMSLIPTDPVQLPKLKKSLYQPTPAQEMSKDNEDQNYQTLQYHTEPYRYF